MGQTLGMARGSTEMRTEGAKLGTWGQNNTDRAEDGDPGQKCEKFSERQHVGGALCKRKQIGKTVKIHGLGVIDKRDF